MKPHILFLLLITACAGPELGEREQLLSSENRLSLNRLSLNRLSLNRLSLNRLSLNRLSFNKLSLNLLVLEGMEESPGGREILKYVATCALPEGQFLVVETDTAGTFEYPGIFGLAPGWETAALSQIDRDMVSGCLLAHVNAYGISVPISLRDAERIPAGPLEKWLFPVFEGAFFGDAMGTGPTYYACTGERAELATALSAERALRVCTDDTVDCRIAVVGRCFDVCDRHDPKYGWSDCWAGGVRYRGTVNAYLPADVEPLGCAAGTDCQLTGSGQPMVFDAEAAGSFAGACAAGSTCAIDCAASDSCHATCSDASQCSVDCSRAGTCGLTCAGDSDCEMLCRDAGDCGQIHCTQKSSCLLDCNGAADCGFATCAGGVTDCGGGVLVCNRECPATNRIETSTTTKTTTKTGATR